METFSKFSIRHDEDVLVSNDRGQHRLVCGSSRTCYYNCLIILLISDFK